MRLAFLTNASAASGVGYYATRLKRALETADPTLTIDEFAIDGTAGVIRKNGQTVASIPPWAGPLRAKTITWIRLKDVIKEQLKQHGPYDVYHATNQTLSFLVEKKLPWVVTVHDLIELTQPQTWFGGLMAQYLYSGLATARQLITVSKYTSHELKRMYPNVIDHVTTIPNGVADPFRLIPGFKQSPTYTTLMQELKLPNQGGPNILHVGSNHPRKNVSTALQVFAELRKEYLDAIFIKVGSAGLKSRERAMDHLIDKLDIREAFFQIPDGVNISDVTLAQLYNAADVLLFPSKLEGFGLPVLQAMACGCPVVTSNATSLPEVVGEAALLCEPDDMAGLLTDVKRILSDAALQQELQAKGLARAKQFAWPEIAMKTLQVYQQTKI